MATRPEEFPNQQLVPMKTMHNEKGVERLQALDGAANLKQTKKVNGFEIDQVLLISET